MWPAPDARARQRLPRVEDLRAAEHGYEREQVREAFDAFYRHVAQLDTTLRALEAVEVFRDQAGELRKELRALKAAGWTQQPWPSYGRERVSPGLPESLPRFALEAVFLIVVAVVVAVAGFDRLSIVLVMALAWAIVGVVEWAASRERFARTRVPAPARAAAEAPAPAPLRVVPAQAGPAESWEAPVAPRELEPAGSSEGEEERTVVQAPAAEAAQVAEPEAEKARELEAEEVSELEAEPVLDASDPAPALDPAELEEPPAVEEVAPAAAYVDGTADEPEPPAEQDGEASGRWSWAADAALERARDREHGDRGDAPRRRFWWRRRRDEDGFRLDPVPPRHVRVLPPEPSFDEQFPVDPDGRADPWERDLDLSIEEPEGPVDTDGDREREAALDRSEPA